VPIAEREGYGNHESKSPGDAKKGAHTNAFKKVVSGFGVGRQAYEGTLDEDYLDADNKAPAAYQVGGKLPKGQYSNGKANTAVRPKGDEVPETPPVTAAPTPAPAPEKTAPVVPQAANAAAPSETVSCEGEGCGRPLAASEVKFCQERNLPMKCWKCRKDKK
jgi:hypothetical protein